MKTEVPIIKPSSTLEGSTKRTLAVKWMNMQDVLTGGEDHTLRIYDINSEKIAT